MPRPTKQRIAAAATILAREWDADGAKAAGATEAYAEWGAGIADMIIHEPPPDTLVEYLGVLEEQIGVAVSPRAERARWAARLITRIGLACSLAGALGRTPTLVDTRIDANERGWFQ